MIHTNRSFSIPIPRAPKCNQSLCNFLADTYNYPALKKEGWWGVFFSTSLKTPPPKKRSFRRPVLLRTFWSREIFGCDIPRSHSTLRKQKNARWGGNKKEVSLGKYLACHASSWLEGLIASWKQTSKFDKNKFPQLKHKNLFITELSH